MADKKCPNCGYWTVGSTTLCDCGYDFEKRVLDPKKRVLVPDMDRLTVKLGFFSVVLPIGSTPIKRGG